MHWASHVNGERLYFCDNCHYKAKNITKLSNHINIGDHLKELLPGSLECNYRNCTYRSKKKENMDMHEDSHVKNIRFLCDLCKYESKKIVQLKGHARREHLNIRQKCDVCDFTANSKGSIQRHRESEHEGKRVTCNLCDYVGRKK